MTSGSFVVDPIFFGNGDVGRLAVCETVNDLAVSGAMPRCLTLSLVIEQGFPTADLTRVLESVCTTALEGDVEVIAGETQIVRSGQANKLRINTTGLGEFAYPLELGRARVSPGDAVIVTGPLGDHGIHLLALEEDSDLAARVPSDCAPLGGLVWNVLEDYALQVHCMRGLARGGLATVLNELADGAEVSIEVEEHRLPVGRETRVAAEQLRVDPLYLASAGAVCMVVEGAAAADVLELIRWQPQGRDARILGGVRERGDSAVMLVGPDGRRPMAARARVARSRR